MDTAKIIENSINKPIKVNSNDSANIDIPLEVSLKRVINVFKQLNIQKIDSITFTIQVSVLVDLPITGRKSLDFEFKKRVHKIEIPEIKIIDTDIEKLGFKDSELKMNIEIINPNSYALKLNDGQIKLLIDNNVDLFVDLKDTINIPANGKDIIPLKFDLKTNKLGKVIWKVLFNKKNTKFSLTIKGVLNTDSKVLKNTNLLITAKGTLAEAFKTIKELKK